MKKERKRAIKNTGAALISVALALFIAFSSTTGAFAVGSETQPQQQGASQVEKIAGEEQHTEPVPESTISTAPAAETQSSASDVAASKPQAEEEEARRTTEGGKTGAEGELPGELAQQEAKAAVLGVPQGGILDGDISLSAQLSHTEYQTFVSLKDGTTPPPLTVSMVVTLNKANIENARIELPYNFIPNATDFPNFDPDYYGQPFFILDTPEAPAASSFVASYDTSDPAKLVIRLKNNLPDGQQTLSFVYRFNTLYNSNIPKGTRLWAVQPTAYIGDIAVAQPPAQEIKTSVTNEITIRVAAVIPIDRDYYNGTATKAEYTTFNNRNYESYFDTNYNNYAYIDVPKGFVTDLLTGVNAKYYTRPVQTVTVNGVQYDRYSHTISDNASDWNYWQYGGNLDLVFFQPAALITPNTPLPNGSQFTIRTGVHYKKINGPVTALSEELIFTTAERPAWKFMERAVFHGPDQGGAFIQDTVVSTAAGSAAKAAAHFGWYDYGWDVNKNEGAGNVSGVKMTLSQPDGSAKINFRFLSVNAFRDPERPSLPWSQYRVDFDIVNTRNPANNRTSSVAVVPSGSGVFGTINVALPTLQNGEYIQNVNLIPTGLDGNQGGILPPGNGFSIQYGACAWSTLNWPDGTAMANSTPVAMQARVFYNKADNTPAVLQSRDWATWYAKAGSTSASAQLTSSNSKGRLPGDTVNYTINGYNNGGIALGGWANPSFAIKVPVQLELQNANTVTLNDAMGGAQNVPVSVTKLGEIQPIIIIPLWQTITHRPCLPLRMRKSVCLPYR